MALAQTDPGDSKQVSKAEEAEWAAMRSACVLDLALRLLLLWTCAEVHDVIAGWVAELVKLASHRRAAQTHLHEGGAFVVLLACS